MFAGQQSHHACAWLLIPGAAAIRWHHKHLFYPWHFFWDNWPSFPQMSGTSQPTCMYKNSIGIVVNVVHQCPSSKQQFWLDNHRTLLAVQQPRANLQPPYKQLLLLYQTYLSLGFYFLQPTYQLQLLLLPSSLFIFMTVDQYL